MTYAKIVRSSLTIIATLATAAIFLPSSALAAESKDTFSADKILAATNRYREELRTNTLHINPLLSASAQAKANDMAEGSYFAHTDPSGRNLSHWLKTVGYKRNYAGENLAVGFQTEEEVLHAWKASSSHYANIIKPEYTEIGIGISRGTYKGRSVIFVVQHFGTPAKPAKNRK